MTLSYVLWVVSVLLMAGLNFRVIREWGKTLEAWKESNKNWDLLCSRAFDLADEINKGSKKEVDEIQDRFFREGYATALRDYGIWKSGTQVIGCLETPVKEILAKRFPNTPYDPNWKSVLDEVSEPGPEPSSKQDEK